MSFVIDLLFFLSSLANHKKLCKFSNSILSFAFIFHNKSGAVFVILKKSLLIVVKDIPRTKSGKIVELAVKNTIEGNKIKNTQALANPEALSQFRNLKELSF